MTRIQALYKLLDVADAYLTLGYDDREIGEAYEIVAKMAEGMQKSRYKEQIRRDIRGKFGG